eukprot:Nitzschia sp. Nitz4//scaffold96_size78090//44471//46170//NITZ4_005497-RA/size78090-processed-gene-0.55-mRNA-1//-1//CDS//3329560582//3472//frame0
MDPNSNKRKWQPGAPQDGMDTQGTSSTTSSDVPMPNAQPQGMGQMNWMQPNSGQPNPLNSMSNLNPLQLQALQRLSSAGLFNNHGLGMQGNNQPNLMQPQQQQQQQQPPPQQQAPALPAQTQLSSVSVPQLQAALLQLVQQSQANTGNVQSNLLATLQKHTSPGSTVPPQQPMNTNLAPPLPAPTPPLPTMPQPQQAQQVQLTQLASLLGNTTYSVLAQQLQAVAQAASAGGSQPIQPPLPPPTTTATVATVTTSTATSQDDPEPPKKRKRDKDSSNAVDEISGLTDKPPTEASQTDIDRMTPAERRRYERNLREQQRSYKINQQIKELRDVLVASNVPFKPNKYSILLSVVEYIKELQSKSTKLDGEHQKLVETICKTSELLSSRSDNGDLGTTSTSENGSDNETLLAGGLDYRSVFEHCPVALGVAALDGRLLDCNPEFQFLLGVPKDDLLKQSLFNLVRNHQEVFQSMAEMLKATEPTTADHQTRAGMKRFWCGEAVSKRDLRLSMTLTLSRGGDGAPRFFNCSISASS